MWHHILSITSLLTIALSDRVDIDKEPIYGFCGTSSTDKFTYLEDAERPFCLKFKGANTGSEPYTTFYYFGGRVDLYTLITLSGSNLGETAGLTGLNWATGRDVTVQFEAGNMTTSTMFARTYSDYTTDENDTIVGSGTTWVFTQLSVVIILDNGKVDEVIWDTGCYACEEKNCIEGNCAMSAGDCQAGTNKCDFSVYLSWYGTDGKGRYLLSAGQRLSQFQSVSAKSYYDYVRNNLDTDVIKFNQGDD